MKKPKVVVTMVEAGMGHIVAATSIYESLKRKYNDIFEVQEVRIYKDSNNKNLSNFEDFLINDVKKTNKHKINGTMQFLAMRLLGDRFTLNFCHKTVFKKVLKETVEYFNQLQPDIIISTHYSVSFFANAYKKKYNKKVLVITYNPDNNTHGWWDREGDLFITNNYLATEEAIEKRKFDINKIAQVPFVTRDVIINNNLSKEECRAKHGLPKNKFTVLIADGAYASAKLKEFTEEMLKTKKEITLIVAACKNIELLNYYKSIKNKVLKNITLVPLEFRKDIHEFYKASDVVITKGGPNAVLDCCFMQTPVIINFYATPIEKTTVKLFINKFKCGEFIDNKVECRERVEEFVDNKELLTSYINNQKSCFNKQNHGGNAAAKAIFMIWKNRQK